MRILRSLLVNTTFLGVFALLLSGMGTWFRHGKAEGRNEQSGGVVQRLFTSPLFLACVVIGSVFNLAFNLYRGYLAPGDLMQDIVAVEQLLEGKSIYPPNMHEIINARLEKQVPSFSLGNSVEKWWPWLKNWERRHYRATTMVQAHTPHSILLVTPLVRFLGMRGSYLAMTLLSLLAILAMLVLIHRELASRLGSHEVTTLTFLVLGWFPVVWTIRHGQITLLLGALLVCGWFCLRRQRPSLAGFAIGLATGLKLFPGLLLIYLEAIQKFLAVIWRTFPDG